MLKLLYAHICDTAFLSQNGNLNLIGIFERLYAKKFPVVHPRLAVITNLTGEVGKHTQEVKIIETKSKTEVSRPIKMDFEIKKENQKLRFILDIVNLTFKAEGDFQVQIILDGELAQALPFKVSTPPKPIPRGK
ncbi:MAG TPA: hypothetical protein ENI70_01770 [Candidatus Peregrinibacteria bacterium]|nr:hypothetical protein [Candidatus Peregrinibacteria bacterium]